MVYSVTIMTYKNSNVCNIMTLVIISWTSVTLFDEIKAQTIQLVDFNPNLCTPECTQGRQSFQCPFTCIVNSENYSFENGHFTFLIKSKDEEQFGPEFSLQLPKECDDYRHTYDRMCFKQGPAMFNVSIFVKTTLISKGVTVKCKLAIENDRPIYSNNQTISELKESTDATGYLTVNGQQALIDNCNITMTGRTLDIYFKCHSSTNQCAIQMEMNYKQIIKNGTNYIHFTEILIDENEIKVHFKFAACSLDEHVTSFMCIIRPGKDNTSSQEGTIAIIISVFVVVIILLIILIVICMMTFSKCPILMKKRNTQVRRQNNIEEAERSEPEQELPLLPNTNDIEKEEHILPKEQILLKNEDISDNSYPLESLQAADNANEHETSIRCKKMASNKSLRRLKKLAQKFVDKHLIYKIKNGKQEIDIDNFRNAGFVLHELLRQINITRIFISLETCKHIKEFSELIDENDMALLIEMANTFMDPILSKTESKTDQNALEYILQNKEIFIDYVTLFATTLVYNIKEKLQHRPISMNSFDKMTFGEMFEEYPTKQESVTQNKEQCTVDKIKHSFITENQLKMLAYIVNENHKFGDEVQKGDKEFDESFTSQQGGNEFIVAWKSNDEKYAVAKKQEHFTQIKMTAYLFSEILEFDKEQLKEDKEFIQKDIRKQGVSGERVISKSNEEMHAVSVGKSPQGVSLVEFQCDDKQNHKEFVSLTEFTLDHLPSLCRHRDLYDLIMLSSLLTVKVLVRLTSKYRNDDSITNYIGYEKGSKALRYGTGRVVHVETFSNREINYCQCHECKHSLPPKKVQGKIFISTSKKIVCDDKEAEHSMCIFNYDYENCEIINLTGSGKTEVKVTNECSVLIYLTCNFKLVQYLEAKLNEYNNVYDKVHNAFKSSSEEHRLAIIVSHPHGFPKHVSVGNWTKKTMALCNGYFYTYDASACDGSIGAHVFILGSSAIAHFNQHIHLGKETETDLNYSSLNTCIHDFNLHKS